MPFRRLEPLLVGCPLGIAIYEQEIVDGVLQDMTLTWTNDVVTRRYGDGYIGSKATDLFGADWPAMRELFADGKPFSYARVYKPREGQDIEPFSYTATAWSEPPYVGVIVTYQNDADDNRRTYESKEVSRALRDIQQRSKDTLDLARLSMVL